MLMWHSLTIFNLLSQNKWFIESWREFYLQWIFDQYFLSCQSRRSSAVRKLEERHPNKIFSYCNWEMFVHCKRVFQSLISTFHNNFIFAADKFKPGRSRKQMWITKQEKPRCITFHYSPSHANIKTYVGKDSISSCLSCSDNLLHLIRSIKTDPTEFSKEKLVRCRWTF